MAQHVITPLYACSFELSHDQFQTRYDDLAADGYRLIMADGHRSEGGVWYAGIWLRDQAAVLTRSRHGLTSSEYQSAYDDLRRRGYLLKGVTGLSAAAGATTATFSAVWNDGGYRGHKIHHDMTASDYQSKENEYGAQGYQVIYVSGYAIGNSSRFAAIWSAYRRNQIERQNLSPASEYQKVFDDFKSQGFRIAHVNAHEVGGQTSFAGIWVKEDGYNPAGRHNMLAPDFKGNCEEFAGADQRLICMSGYREAGQNKYAAIWAPQPRTWLAQGRTHSSLQAFDSKVKSFMTDPTRTIPSGSLAVTRNGELVLARGYSWITDIETPVEPTSLFRLASVSKTLTGAAIVLLAEQGKLSFLDKVVNLIDMPGTIADPRVNDIKVEHLLYHVGGWDRTTETGSAIEPTNLDIQVAKDYGMNLPITREALMRWMNEKYTNKEKKKLLDFTPGAKPNAAKYSNYGYMLLGQIIETVTGIPYEQFVQEQLLTPLGIRRMRLGRTLLRNRLPGEVLYHGRSFGLHKNVVADVAPQDVMHQDETVMLQYGGYFSIENVSANGGWVGTAVDLVRFASAFDDRNKCPILSPASVDKLFATHVYGNQGPTDPDHFGCGWTVTAAGDASKTGGFEGTSTALSRWKNNDGNFCAALLFNKSDDNDIATPEWNLRQLIRDAANDVSRNSTWPTDGFWDDYI